MLASVHSESRSRDALPACLWRENPNRLVNHWEIMRSFFPAMYTSLYGSVYVPALDVRREGGATIAAEPIPEDTKKLIHAAHSLNRPFSVELGLMASVATIDKIIALASSPTATWGPFHELGKELQGRLNDELGGRLCFSLSYSESQYYSKPTEGWKEVIDRFPAAITDIEEMSKCFALSRYAGAVFHSVQAIECGLIELGKFISVNDPKSGWTAVTGKLATLVTKTKYPDLEPLYQKHFTFLEQMQGTIGALNNAWRNKISHAQGRLVLMTSEFSPEVAEEIMIASRSFMRRLATELPQ